MHHVFNRIPLVVAAIVAAAPTFAQSGSFSGTYTSKSEDGTMTLTLMQAADGTVTGTLKEDESVTELRGRGPSAPATQWMAASVLREKSCFRGRRFPSSSRYGARGANCALR